MLALTRKNGESVQIGDDITVTIVKSSNSEVKLSIDAPKDIKILRPDAKKRTK